MANLNDKELSKLQEDLKLISELNQQIANYTKAQFKACQLVDEAEDKLQKFYAKLEKKYNKEGKIMKLNTQDGVINFEEKEK